MDKSCGFSPLFFCASSHFFFSLFSDLRCMAPLFASFLSAPFAVRCVVYAFTPSAQAISHCSVSVPVAGQLPLSAVPMSAYVHACGEIRHFFARHRQLPVQRGTLQSGVHESAKILQVVTSELPYSLCHGRENYGFTMTWLLQSRKKRIIPETRQLGSYTREAEMHHSRESRQMVRYELARFTSFHRNPL